MIKKVIIDKSYILKVLKKKKINSNIKKQILKLKKQHYKFSIKKQLKWFEENINSDDYHNLLFSKKVLIGYNCLRSTEIFITKKKNIIKKKFYLFDTLVLNKKFRNLGLSKKIMISSNKIILNKKCLGLLFCNNKMINYYSKFGWKFLKKEQIISKRSSRLNTMIFNFNNKKNKIFSLKV